MPLTQVAINANISWALARAVTGFANVTQGPDAQVFASNALDVATWNELFLARYTIAASGTQAVDLRTFTNLVADAATADKGMAILILVTGAVADVLNVKTHGTSGLQWFFEDATKGVNIPGGGMILFSEGPTSAGTTIDATHKQLLLTNNGSAALTVTVVAILSDV